MKLNISMLLCINKELKYPFSNKAKRDNQCKQ